MFGLFGSDRKPLAKRGIKKMDAVVTGLILGGIVASIYGIKKVEEEVEKSNANITDPAKKHSFFSVLRMLAFGVENPQKPGIIRRIFGRSNSWKN